MSDIALSEYLELDARINKRKVMPKGSVNIAILSSFTTNGFKEVLNVKCHEMGLKAYFYVAGYNQYAQDLSDRGGPLYNFKPDITFLLVDAGSIIKELLLDPYKFDLQERKNIIGDSYKRLEGLIDKFTKYGTGILVMNNLEVPTHSPIGILETKEDMGLFDLLISFNERLSRFARNRSIFIYDCDSFLSGIGKDKAVDYKLLYLADMKISPDVIPLLCGEYMRYIRALKGLTRKCIVVDLDNTMWGGIIGEDGIEGIKLSPTGPGSAYMDFQKMILAFFHRGMILAINSSNNREDALKVLREHPYMVLKEEHFASIKINWENKVKNLVDIAKDINIGLDSIVYFEDDKRIRQVVKEALPEVLCPDLPEDASEYCRFLRGLKEMDTLQITQEDKARGIQYSSQRRRHEVKNAFSDLSEYLNHLNIKVEVKPADKFSIPRISQLTIRTNQFNFSSKRYDEKALARLAKDKRHGVYFVNVKDIYGDYGISGAVIIDKEDDGWLIDSFLLSCRILGKNVEDAVMGIIVKQAMEGGVDQVDIRCEKSGKNAPVFNFLKANGLGAAMDKKRTAIITLYKAGGKNKFFNRCKHIKVIG